MRVGLCALWETKLIRYYFCVKWSDKNHVTAQINTTKMCKFIL
jgi:hypothetical protein